MKTGFRGMNVERRDVASDELTIDGQVVYTNSPSKSALMRLFTERPLEYVRFDELVQKTDLSHEQIIQAILAINQEGITIGSRSGNEYFYEPNEFRLHPDVIAAQLNTRWWGRAIYVGRELTSTIDIAKSLLSHSRRAPHGVVIAADYQSKGRGRQGNIWLSSKGKDILMTFMVLAEGWKPSPSLLSLYAASAVARVLETAYQIPVTIKWPNDLMVNEKKVGGVLVEWIDHSRIALISLGLNVFSRRSDWPVDLRTRTTSLTLIKDEEWRRDLLIAQCGTTWEGLWETMPRDRGETVRGYWKYYSSTVGKRVNLIYRNTQLSGIAHQIDEFGRLVFRTDRGDTLHLLSEEVREVRLEEQ